MKPIKNINATNKRYLDLSICIPSYNYAQYLSFAIDSCLNNDYDFELVIVDNCSKDNTNELKEKFVYDKRVKWFTNVKTLPIVQNWNHTVSLANRKYVKLLLADDYLEQNFFKLFIDATSKFPDQAIYGHLTKIVNEDNIIKTKGVKYSIKEKYVLVKGTKYIQMKLQNIARFKETSCNFFSKEKWEKIGGFSKEFTFCFDLIFNSALAYNYGGCLISDYGSYIRRHGASDNLNKSPDLSVKELNTFVKNLLKYIGQDVREIDIHYSKSILQYRIIELFFQRFNKKPLDTIRFIFKHISFFSSIRAYKYTLSTIIRKFKTNDAQQYLENFE